VYIPQAFVETDPERIAPFVDAHPLATLIALSGGRLDAHHLPFLRLAAVEAGQRFVAHVARGNPLWRLAESGIEVLLVFAGAGAYVSPAYYPGKAEHRRVVPTWNYAAVHVHGWLTSVHDRTSKLHTVELLTRRMEAGREQPWAVTDAPPAYIDKMLDGIVGLSLEVRSVEAKFKASQNRSDADRQGVVVGLRADPGVASALEAADMVEAVTPPLSGR
jgi:transcriptional regulator